MWLKAAPEKLENSLQGEGRVRDTENTLLYRNFRCLCRKVYFFFRHLGRLSQRRLTGNSLSTRGAFQPSSPWRRKKMPSKFVVVSIPATCGIKTTSWNCKSATRINVFPLPRKKMTVLRFDSCAVNSFEWIKWKGFGVTPDGVCVLFHATVCEL